MVSTREYLEFATDICVRAGRSTLSYFQMDVEVDRKEDDSPVTVADREGEELLRRLISHRFPKHGICGEEMGESESDATHRWFIDPIDGTRSFIRGVPLYGVLLGLEIEGEMVVGVCYLPALDELVSAGRGEGAWWNGRPARVSSAARLEDALVSMTEPGSLEDGQRGGWEALRERVETVRGFSDCYGHCLVATGRCEIMLDPIMNSWDSAPFLPILEEAGGTFTDWGGRRTVHGGSAVSTNGALFEPLMELLT